MASTQNKPMAMKYSNKKETSTVHNLKNIQWIVKPCDLHLLKRYKGNDSSWGEKGKSAKEWG